MAMMFVLATITKFKRLDPGDLRLIELTLPASLTVDGKEHPIQDGMRPGAGFWVQPRDEGSKEPWQRFYFRSNCSISARGHLETIITNTYDKSDTWSWWQTEGLKEG